MCSGWTSDTLPGSGRQHGRCLLTTQSVTGLSTSAGEAGLFLPIYYMVRLCRLTYTGNVFRAALIYMGFCYSGHTMGTVSKIPAGWVCDTLSFSGYHKPLFCFLSVHLTEEPFFIFLPGYRNILSHCLKRWIPSSPNFARLASASSRVFSWSRRVLEKNLSA